MVEFELYGAELVRYIHELEALSTTKSIFNNSLQRSKSNSFSYSIKVILRFMIKFHKNTIIIPIKFEYI